MAVRCTGLCDVSAILICVSCRCGPACAGRGLARPEPGADAGPAAARSVAAMIQYSPIRHSVAENLDSAENLARRPRRTTTSSRGIAATRSRSLRSVTVAGRCLSPRVDRVVDRASGKPQRSECRRCDNPCHLCS
jgi:hypothetical protein